MAQVSFVTRNGLRLVADTAGDAACPAVILLHGGGQTRHSWGKALASLAEAGFYGVALDLRGHGDSDWAADGRYDLGALRDDLLDVVTHIGGRPPLLVGASLGGMISLLAARAARAHALVLVDVVPQVEAEGVAEIVGFMSRHRDGFAHVADAAAAVSAYLPHRRRPQSNAGLAKNLRLRGDGRYYWHWDPALLAATPAEWTERLEDAARQITAPALLLRGTRSRVVSLEGVRHFLALLPHAEFVDVADADHMIAGDDNDAFTTPLLAFLARHRPAPPRQ